MVISAEWLLTPLNTQQKNQTHWTHIQKATFSFYSFKKGCASGYWISGSLLPTVHFWYYRKFDCQAKEAEILARNFWFERPTHGTKAEDSKPKATTASENVDRRKLTYDHHRKRLEPSLFLMPVQYWIHLPVWKHLGPGIKPVKTKKFWNICSTKLHYCL